MHHRLLSPSPPPLDSVDCPGAALTAASGARTEPIYYVYSQVYTHEAKLTS